MEPPPRSPDLSPTLPPLSLAPGLKVFGRFTLVRILGRGAMGVVWLVEDAVLGENVALKFLPDVVRWDHAGLAELKAETSRARSLAHPGIVRVFDFLTDATTSAIAMEFVEGETLAERLARAPGRVLTPAEIAGWLPHLGAALDYSHLEARIVHRDIKPANIMLTREGRVKITDFGVARTLADTMTRVSSWHLGGTLVYMGPQQQMGESPSPADDIYSLGVVLYELLAGKPPFYTGNVVAQIHARAPESIAGRRRSLGIDGADIPPSCEALIRACLEKDPARRPKTATEVAARFVASLGTVARPRSARRVVPWLVGAALVGVVALLVVFWPHRPTVSAEPAAPVPAPEPVTIPAMASAPFMFSETGVGADGDMRGLVQREGGAGAVIGEWSEFKAWVDTIDAALAAALPLGAHEQAWVLREGVESPDDKLRFCIRRPGGPGVPSTIETAAAGAFELSYATGGDGRVLIRRPAAVPAKGITLQATTNAYGAGEDFSLIVRQEFGESARIVDWSEVVALDPADVNDLLAHVRAGASRGFWIRFAGQTATPDDRARYWLRSLDPDLSEFAYARDERLGLMVSHNHRDALPILVHAVEDNTTAAPAPLFESVTFDGGRLPAPWRLSGAGSDAALGEGRITRALADGVLVLHRPLAAGRHGLAVTVKGSLADAVLGMHHELGLRGTGGQRFVVRIERPAGVESGLRVSMGPAGAPVLVRRIAAVFGETELRVVAADRRIRLQLISPGNGAEYFSETAVIDEFRCGEIESIEWSLACSGAPGIWISRLDLRAQ